jgi:hypothetical protein
MFPPGSAKGAHAQDCVAMDQLLLPVCCFCSVPVHCPEHCVAQAKADVELCCPALPLNSRRHIQTCESQKYALLCPAWAALPVCGCLFLNVRLALSGVLALSHSH